MSEQDTISKPSTNGRSSLNSSTIKRRKQWKDLPPDTLSDGFSEHQAVYTVGNSPLSWSQLQVGQLFCRSKTGKAVHVKVNAGRGICLDTQAPIEVKPSIRNSLQVWLVTSINTTTATAPVVKES